MLTFVRTHFLMLIQSKITQETHNCLNLQRKESRETLYSKGTHEDTEINRHLLERLRKPNKGEWMVGKDKTMSTDCVGRVGKMRQSTESQAKQKSYLLAL